MQFSPREQTTAGTSSCPNAAKRSWVLAADAASLPACRVRRVRGDVTPFAIHDSARFRLNPPPLLHTAKYAKDYAEVKALGGVISTSRPADRADVARFYAAVLPMPLWPAAARQASAAQGKTLSENAREFAWLTMAVCDGLIASMKMKYHYNLWRPATAIREGDTDGNPQTIPDGGWESFVFTPSYPELSGKPRHRRGRRPRSARACLRS